MTDMSKKDEVCNVNPEDCKIRFDKIDSKLDDIHNRLFVDNGKPAFSTRLDRLEQAQKGRNIWIDRAITFVLSVLLIWVGMTMERVFAPQKNTPSTQSAKP